MDAAIQHIYSANTSFNTGNDTTDGGGRAYTAVYSATQTGTVADLTAGTADDGFGGADTFNNVENVSDSHHDDIISGNELNNVLDGADPSASGVTSDPAHHEHSENTDIHAAAEEDATVVRTGDTDTIPGDTSTGYSLAIGDSATGNINTESDLDWFQVTRLYLLLVLRS